MNPAGYPYFDFAANASEVHDFILSSVGEPNQNFPRMRSVNVTVRSCAINVVVWDSYLQYAMRDLSLWFAVPDPSNTGVGAAPNLSFDGYRWSSARISLYQGIAGWCRGILHVTDIGSSIQQVGESLMQPPTDREVGVATWNHIIDRWLQHTAEQNSRARIGLDGQRADTNPSLSLRLPDDSSNARTANNLGGRPVGSTGMHGTTPDNIAELIEFREDFIKDEKKVPGFIYSCKEVGIDGKTVIKYAPELRTKWHNKGYLPTADSVTQVGKSAKQQGK